MGEKQSDAGRGSAKVGPRRKISSPQSPKKGKRRKGKGRERKDRRDQPETAT